MRDLIVSVPDHCLSFYFDIMHWVKELKIKIFDGVLKDSRQWAYNCGIINLDRKRDRDTLGMLC